MADSLRDREVIKFVADVRGYATGSTGRILKAHYGGVAAFSAPPPTLPLINYVITTVTIIIYTVILIFHNS